jgi:hypothetical protein
MMLEKEEDRQSGIGLYFACHSSLVTLHIMLSQLALNWPLGLLQCQKYHLNVNTFKLHKSHI